MKFTQQLLVGAAAGLAVTLFGCGGGGDDKLGQETCIGEKMNCEWNETADEGKQCYDPKDNATITDDKHKCTNSTESLLQVGAKISASHAKAIAALRSEVASLRREMAELRKAGKNVVGEAARHH